MAICDLGWTIIKAGVFEIVFLEIPGTRNNEVSRHKNGCNTFWSDWVIYKDKAGGGRDGE